MRPQSDTRIGLDPLRLNHDWYPQQRRQTRCYCGAKKTPGLLTCGEHSLDVKIARHTEILLGGRSRPTSAHRRTYPLDVPGAKHRSLRELHAKAVKLRHEQPDLSIREIARRVGATYPTAWLWLRDRAAVTP